MKAAVSIACGALLSGCQSVPPAYGEAAWQALHAVDTAQTLHVARSPECYYERAPLTRALVGAHPSEAEVAAVMLGYALLHRYLTEHLEGRWLRVYQATSFISTARNVVRNHNIGLRPLGAGCGD